MASDDTATWVAAGDQAIFNISGVDISKIRYPQLFLLCA